MELLKAKITGLKPSAGYMDVIYEQTVELELPSGKRIGLFDSLPKATSEMIGITKNMVVLAYITKIERIPETEHRIEPFHEEPLGWKNHMFYGKIEEIGIEDEWHEGDFKYKNLVLLYVGEGNILVKCDYQTLNLIKKGNYLKVSALRSDLLGIN